MDITPETKVGALLEAHPELEQVLIEASPVFEKLKNPVLRRSVAKLVSLRQAAETANISADALVDRLRAAVGQAPMSGRESAQAVSEGGRPEWAIEERVQARVKAEDLLEGGVHPLGKVREMLAGLPPGAVVKVSSSFRPVPLEEALRKSGIPVWVEQVGDQFETWISGR